MQRRSWHCSCAHDDHIDREKSDSFSETTRMKKNSLDEFVDQSKRSSSVHRFKRTINSDRGEQDEDRERHSSHRSSCWSEFEDSTEVFSVSINIKREVIAEAQPISMTNTDLIISNRRTIEREERRKISAAMESLCQSNRIEETQSPFKLFDDQNVKIFQELRKCLQHFLINKMKIGSERRFQRRFR
jgi:hypothetical protein